MDSHLLIQSTLNDVNFFVVGIMSSCVSYIIGRNEQSLELICGLWDHNVFPSVDKYGAAQYQVFPSLAPLYSTFDMIFT